ncbi:MAG: hypothetical protein R3223_06595 [Longimicrobiales bacterium]|nr:hypothetical protein [Longimicrobiales bacterium]
MTCLAVAGFLAVVVSPGLVAGQASGDRESPTRSDAPAEPRAVGTMLELMEKIIYPTSNTVFYAGSRTPTDDAGWSELEADALMLAESANLLMMPGRAVDDGQWMRDARLMLDAGEAAFQAAKERDVEALQALNDPLYQSCVTCHEHYDVQ